MGGRSTRGWLQLAATVGLVLLLATLLQVTAERTNRRFDLTPTRALSLSPVTQSVLAEVKAPLTVTVFHRRGMRAPYAALLARLRAVTPQIQYELLDLDRYPERARGYGITQYGRAAVEYEGRRRVVPALPEEQLVGAILGVIRGRTRRLAVTTGHGERPPGGDQQSVSRLLAALDAENYAPEPVSLLDGPVPDGTDLVLVAGPHRDFLPVELERLGAYLRGGGGVVLLLDPAPLPMLSGFLGSMGIRLGQDLIVDRERRVVGTDGLAAVVEQFRTGNPVSEPDGNPIGSGVVLPSARSVDVAGDVPGVVAESIARTGESAWAMADAERARRGEEPSKAAHDVPGPLSVMVLAELGGGEHRPGRLVVIGDVDFASDAYLDVLGNRDVALNAAAWAAGEEALTSGERQKRIPEVERPLSPLVLTDRQARGILFGVTVVQPGLVLATGVLVVALRRRRG